MPPLYSGLWDGYTLLKLYMALLLRITHAYGGVSEPIAGHDIKYLWCGVQVMDTDLDLVFVKW